MSFIAASSSWSSGAGDSFHAAANARSCIGSPWSGGANDADPRAPLSDPWFQICAAIHDGALRS